MRFKKLIDKNQIFLIPCIGVINDSRYYGYPVFSIAFAWLIWRCKVQFGVKKRRAGNG